MNKHTVRFCKCGKIHLIPNDKLDKAYKSDKDLLFVCADCGAASIMGADKEADGAYIYYLTYSYDFSDKSTSITQDCFSGSKSKKAISEIYYSHGIKVPMKNGYYATRYFNDMFMDDRFISNLYEIDRYDVSPEEVHEFIEKTKHEMCTVNMVRFIRETPDEALEEISKYYVPAFDWSGTKYQKLEE